MHRHTLLVNKTLSLGTAGMGDWPPTLHRHGYRACAIERSVDVGDRIVVPDVIFINKGASHLLVVDCKSGASINKDQDGRYARMRLEDLTRATGQAGRAKSHTFAYAIDEAHLDRMRLHTDFSLIAFGSHMIRAVGSLGHPGLDKELQGGVALDAPSPRTRAYPFSIHDDPAHVDRITAQGIRGYLVNHPDRAKACLSSDAVANWILCSTHPLHDRFSPEHRAELAGAIGRSIRRLYAADAVGSLADASRPARRGGEHTSQK